MPQAKLPVVVMLSGNGSTLQAILDAPELEALIEIHGVISDQADAYGLERAAAHHISTAHIPKLAADDAQTYTAKLITQLNDWQPKLIVLAGYMRILSAAFVQRYALQIINIHPSLLPHYKGLNTHQRVLDAGEVRHGTSVHVVNAELDAGTIIAQAPCPVRADDTAETLSARVKAKERELYPKVIAWLARGELVLTDHGAYLNHQCLPEQGWQLPDLPGTAPSY